MDTSLVGEGDVRASRSRPVRRRRVVRGRRRRRRRGRRRRDSFMIIFEASKNLSRFRRVSGPVLVVAYEKTVPRACLVVSAGHGPLKGEII